MTGLDVDAVAHHERADALRAAELVGAHRHQVGGRRQRGHVEPREGLHGVGVEGGVRRPVAHDGRHLGQRLDGADLVVGQHHRHHADAVVEGIGEGVEVDDAVGSHGNDAAAERLARVQHGVVLGGQAHHGATPAGVDARDGQVVGLGAAAGEHHLAGRAPRPAATTSRASSSAARASRATACTPDGLPNRSVRNGSMAASASGRSGVVAALSR